MLFPTVPIVDTSVGELDQWAKPIYIVTFVSAVERRNILLIFWIGFEYRCKVFVHPEWVIFASWIDFLQEWDSYFNV